MVCIICNVVDEETVLNYNYYVKTKNFAITFVNRWRKLQCSFFNGMFC